MANYVFNIAKGQIAEYVRRVDTNDPANSAIILVPLSASGTEAQGQDLDTLAAVEADANFAEQTAGGWVRKTLTDTNFAATDYEVDDTNNRFDCALPTVTWTAPTAGSNTTGLLVCYDPDTTAGTDSNIIPLTHHDFAVTADGNDVVLSPGDFFRAS
jgi:hypothetical protein